VTTTPPIIPTPRRRWLQFTLRTMLVLILIVSVPLGWFAHKLRQAEQQREAVREIEEIGGTAVQCPNFDPRDSWASRVPSRLRRTLGDEFFVTVNYVSLSGARITDTDLMRLRAFPRLRALYARRCRVTDAGLVHLRELVHLEELSLHSTRITDAGLEHLRGLTQLQVLWLRNTQVTDAGVTELQKALPNAKIIR
jgi:hypothetical protein